MHLLMSIFTDDVAAIIIQECGHLLIHTFMVMQNNIKEAIAKQ
jgi:hypothetical protein